MEHTKHIWRLAILVVFSIVGFVISRMLVVPDTYGMYGPYRYANVGYQMAIEPRHGEVKGCLECHEGEEESDLHQNGPHKVVACENCHAPMSTHVKDEEYEWEMTSNTTGKWCIRCHLEIPTRPKKQPQIDPVEHLREVSEKPVGRDWSDQVCFECHEPHDPTPEES